MPSRRRCARGSPASGRVSPSSARRPAATIASGWILDPIDGTRNYTRGIPIWATLIAYADRVAVVSAPALGRRWWAVRGEGAYASGERIRVSGIDRIEDATLLFALDRPVPERAFDALARARLR